MYLRLFQPIRLTSNAQYMILQQPQYSSIELFFLSGLYNIRHREAAIAFWLLTMQIANLMHTNLTCKRLVYL